MIFLPLGKALIAVKSPTKCNFECMDDDFICPKLQHCCKGCVMKEKIELKGNLEKLTCDYLCCTPQIRGDGEKVIYKIVDYPEKLNG
jgi:hypothetical protein